MPNTVTQEPKKYTAEDFKRFGQQVAQASNKAVTAEQKTQELSATVDSILTDVLPSLMNTPV